MKLDTDAKIVWCPGCGNYSILKAFKNAVVELPQTVKPEKMVVVSGVGCHGKIANYINLSSFHGIHGRVPSLMAGIKLANAELTVVGFSGDGDTFNEGLVHLMHAAKKNINATLIVHNNKVYGLTTGQASATSPRGFRGKSTPEGNPEDPFNTVALMLVAGATFVARAFPGDIKHLTEIIKQAIMHKGFSFIDVLQPCVTFNNTWDYYRKSVYKIEETPSTLDEAIKLAYSSTPTKIPIGIFYQKDKQTFEELVRVEETGVGVEKVLELME